MKKYIPWLLVAALAFSNYYFYNAGKVKGAVFGYTIGYQDCQNEVQERAITAITTQITYCESRDIHDRTSPKGAYGRAQFMERTFNWMKKLAGKPKLSWRSEADQMWLLDWAVRNGYGKHWQTCYKQAVHKYVKNELPNVLASVGIPNDILAVVKF